MKIATSNEDIERCFPVMQELRTHLNAGSFLERVRDQEAHGYQLGYLEEEGKIVAVAGFRVSSNLFVGKHLYVDDLVTAERARSKGYGKALMSALRNIAIENNCSYFHLDSGTQRDQAHKFYFREGMTISTFHFSETL